MAIQYHPIRITHRDALWDFAKAQAPGALGLTESSSPEALKLSAIQIGQGWGELAADGKDWLGYYFINPTFLNCELIHFFVRPDLIEKEVGQNMIKQAIFSVKKAGFHDELISYVSSEIEPVFTAVGFRNSEAPFAVETRLSCSGQPQGVWKKIKVL